MASVAPHIHISGISGIVDALYTIVIFGFLMIAARRFEGHPLADAFRSIFA